MLGESYRQRNPRVGDNTTDHIKGKGYPREDEESPRSIEVLCESMQDTFVIG